MVILGNKQIVIIPISGNIKSKLQTVEYGKNSVFNDVKYVVTLRCVELYK